MNKKAITPLISTFFLIIFAIGLGTLVMSWGNSNLQKTDLSCKNAELSITTINNSRQICLEGNKIKSFLENNGNIAIDSIRLVVLTSDSVLTGDSEVNILPGEFKQVTFPESMGDISKILKIRLIPQVDNELCVESRAEVERIGVC
ncbi:MAG: hypothetical protein KAK00_08365 [Nanoarchaeota archaeon]|nr:hypothetical protein [Nanoarchaeota archaeon]